MNMNWNLKWGATTVSIAGAILTALNIYPLNVWIFSIGCILWSIFAIRIKENSILVLNLTMLVIYAYGALKGIL